MIQKTQHNPEPVSPKGVSIPLKLEAVKIISINIIGNEIMSKKIISKKFGFELGFKSNIIQSKSLIAIFTNVKVYSDKEAKILLGEIKTFNLFRIKNLSKFLIKEENKFKIPEFLLASLLGISISNTRGILVAKASGTILENAIIPVLNPTAIIRNSKVK
jgi:hypothetical protein